MAKLGARSVLLSSLAVTAVVGGTAELLQIFEPSEFYVYDMMTWLQPDEDVDPRLVVVGITETDLAVQKQWPLNDQILAEVLATLQTHQPTVVGLDIYRNVPHPPGNDQLLQQLQADNLIAITNVGGSSEVAAVESPPTVPEQRVGFNDLVLDRGGLVRRNLLFVPTASKEFYSFGLRVSLAYLASQSDPATNAERALLFRFDQQGIYVNGVPFPRLPNYAGGYARADTSGYQIMAQYRDRNQVARQISVTDVLNGNYDPDWIEGKIVLIGVTAPSLKDLFLTPYSTYQQSEMPGVFLHAQMISQILSTVEDQQALFRFWPRWGEWLWLWSCAVAGGMLGWWVRNPRWLAIAGAASPLVILGFGWLSFNLNLWIPVVTPIATLLAAGILVISYRLSYSTSRDWTTGLPNRDEFIRRVQQFLNRSQRHKSDQSVAVMFLNLERFKIISESVGQDLGNQFLNRIVSRIHSLLPSSAQLARVGGDEFAILFPYETGADVSNFADDLQAQLSAPFSLENREVSTSVSIGIALAQQGYAHRPENFLRDAHTAMYRAKALGKARHEVFAAGMLNEVIDRLQMESDLRQGLEHREFSLHYQPIIQLDSGLISGFEALARWRHHQRGFVSPGAFIPVAEETGLIVPLGEWIFREACQQIRDWQEQFSHYPSLSMSINLSGRQFTHADLAGQLGRILQDVGIGGEHIRIEITESMVMSDVEAAIDLMLSLKALNFKLSIDDFGTGYSSLSYLHRFPMDTLKIDQSFISRMEEDNENHEIVQTIISLGHNLGMEIVAEGVESQAQVSILKRLQCEYGQGYYFAKPLSQQQMDDFLSQPRHWA